MWKDSLQLGRPQITKRRRRIAYWITTTTYAHSECNTYSFFHRNNGSTNTPQCYVISTVHRRSGLFLLDAFLCYWYKLINPKSNFHRTSNQYNHRQQLGYPLVMKILWVQNRGCQSKPIWRVWLLLYGFKATCFGLHTKIHHQVCQLTWR